MQNAGLDETEAGIKIAGRSSNNLSYTYRVRVEWVLVKERIYLA